MSPEELRVIALDRAITTARDRAANGGEAGKTGPLLTEAKKFEKYLSGNDTSAPAGDSE